MEQTFERHPDHLAMDWGEQSLTYAQLSERVERAASALIRMGTLSKALASAGGFVSGSTELVDWLANRARSYVFSTAQPAATAAVAETALDIVQNEPERRQQLLARAQSLREQLSEQGWNTGNSQSQIIPLFVGDADRTMRMSAELRARGFLVPGIRPPTVPQGESLLRIGVCWHHDEEILGQLLAALEHILAT